MPPEIMQQFQDEVTAVALDGTKCDVFSYAVLALYALTGVSPHEGLNNNDIFVKVSVCPMQSCREFEPFIWQGYLRLSALSA